MTEEAPLAAAAPVWDGEVGEATPTADTSPKSAPRDREVAFKLPKLTAWIGRRCTNARGGPSVACCVFVAAPAMLGIRNLTSIEDSSVMSDPVGWRSRTP